MFIRPNPLFKVLLASTLVLGLLGQSACSLKFPRLHRVTIQQGNVITQDMINKLKPGMSRSQVAFVMGEPIMKNPFDEDRWNYIYTLNLPGYYSDRRHVSLYFHDGILAYMTGDIAPQTESQIEAAKAAAAQAKADAEAAAKARAAAAAKS